jgi:hypothetical protein
VGSISGGACPSFPSCRSSFCGLRWSSWVESARPQTHGLQRTHITVLRYTSVADVLTYLCYRLSLGS